MDCQIHGQSAIKHSTFAMKVYRVDVADGDTMVPSGFTIVAESEESAYNLSLVALKRLKSSLEITDLAVTEQPMVVHNH